MHVSLPSRLIIRIALTATLLLALQTYLPQYLSISGGITGIAAVTALLTLLNLTIRPILSVLSIPVRLMATLLAVIVVNGVFLWLVMHFAGQFDPEIAGLTIHQGWIGYTVLATLFGTSNWLMKLVLRC